MENEEFLTQQLITYLGNKRSLLNFIGDGINLVKSKMKKEKLNCFDVFSGSGIVSRYLKQHSNKLIVNDIELYSNVINNCYLANKSSINIKTLKQHHNLIVKRLNDENLIDGFITELYAPKDTFNIKSGERCFYTNRNAKYIDTARKLISDIPEAYQRFLLAPLLSEASIHNNTSGVFKGFYKDSKTGIGKFGGDGENALTRILGNIELKLPIFSNYDCEVDIRIGDSNIIVDSVDEVDVAYIDPPYNQHPYGSNYFMLNLIVKNERPDEISDVSGITKDWYKSKYNKKQFAYDTLFNLCSKIRSKFLLISFNSEGFISKENMLELLNKVGKVDVLETKYNTFRGSRNLNKRDIHVSEYLYMVEK